MAATVPGAATLGLPKEQKKRSNKVMGLVPEQNGQELYAIFKADSLSRFYVPAVMMGHDKPPPPASRTVHILGQDERSKYLSHALHGIYDSIQTVGKPRGTKYRNITENMGRKKTDGAWIDSNAAMEEAKKSEQEQDDGHISNLVVAGSPGETKMLLKRVKHRVDERTAICYMQEGLGIAEMANRDVFQDEERRPAAVLGHMSHSLAYDRSSKSVKLMAPEYETALTDVRGMLELFGACDLLKARGMRIENWLHRKIPSLMFSSVIDPVCVLLDCRYEELLQNRTAHRLVFQLIDEIAEAVVHMGETKHSPELCALLKGEGMRKEIFGKLRGKGSAPSKMALQIQRGQMTDIDFLNGYFMDRGRRAGVNMPANAMIVGMVKAKHKAQNKKLGSYIPFEVTSRR
ncbi:putative 2-dehydropantoate 2-reductase 1 [Colletotrichum chlorophyti]|uniref:Putative 2-dehydropantoate 2-reductase 1 n=1 Tax=Colletotrichum chlorophyti TaxID=708187 RepID=A0A1Q8RNW9_9PEZI|nr:putative 2-dehydropantoate 2-reductase 1 [Colletotrichum chlorophyti]